MAATAPNSAPVTTIADLQRVAHARFGESLVSHDGVKQLWAGVEKSFHKGIARYDDALEHIKETELAFEALSTIAGAQFLASISPELRTALLRHPIIPEFRDRHDAYLKFIDTICGISPDTPLSNEREAREWAGLQPHFKVEVATELLAKGQRFSQLFVRKIQIPNSGLTQEHQSLWVQTKNRYSAIKDFIDASYAPADATRKRIKIGEMLASPEFTRACLNLLEHPRFEVKMALHLYLDWRDDSKTGKHAVDTLLANLRKLTEVGRASFISKFLTEKRQVIQAYPVPAKPVDRNANAAAGQGAQGTGAAATAGTPASRSYTPPHNVKLSYSPQEFHVLSQTIRHYYHDETRVGHLARRMLETMPFDKIFENFIELGRTLSQSFEIPKAVTSSLFQQPAMWRELARPDFNETLNLLSQAMYQVQRLSAAQSLPEGFDIKKNPRVYADRFALRRTVSLLTEIEEPSIKETWVEVKEIALTTTPEETPEKSARNAALDALGRYCKKQGLDAREMLILRAVVERGLRMRSGTGMFTASNAIPKDYVRENVKKWRERETSEKVYNLTNPELTNALMLLARANVIIIDHGLYGLNPNRSDYIDVDLRLYMNWSLDR